MMLKKSLYVISFLFISCSQAPPRTDAELSNFFFKNKSSFDELRSALLLDREIIKRRSMDKYGINCVKDSTSTLGGIDSLPNGNKYKKQMGAIEAIGACASDSEVEITLGAEGLLDDGEIWGVSWRPETPELNKIKSSIDINGFPKERSRSDDDKYYRRLEGKWYLFKKH